MSGGILETIESLCGIPGVSGWEKPVRDEIRRRIGEHCADMKTDALGNLLVYKKGKKTPRNRLMLSAHMDEVGFIVTHIEEDGLLRFTTVGGVDSRVVAGKAVEVGTNRLHGVIGAKATHLLSDAEKDEAPNIDKLFIDIGADSREEAEKQVRPGDRAVWYAPFWRLGADCILGRAFDDRAGCALLIGLILADLEYDCHFAFTVQEETGCTGAVTAACAVEPGIGIVVETTTAGDIAGVPADKRVCVLGEGPVLSFMDRGTVYDMGLYRQALDTARRLDIPCQVKTAVAGGNESRSVQASGGGVRTLAVSLPCRYIHSPSNMLHIGDVDNTLKLLVALIEEFGAESRTPAD